MISPETNWLIQYLNKEGYPEEVKASEEALYLYSVSMVSEYYQSKEERLAEWNPLSDELFELVMDTFCICLMHETLTYQALIGMLSGKVSCEDPLDRAKCAAEVIAVIGSTGLIEVQRKHSGYIVYTEFQLDDPIPVADRHQPLTSKPETKTTNQLLGSRFKQHDKETCLDHINRMNSIGLQLNLPLLRTISEEATFELDTIQKKDQWDLFVSRSYKAYLKLARGENKFWLEHAYDTRGRVYCEGYYVNYQGSSFKKAVCMLAKEEVVQL
jgi:hypothetical protein